MTFGAAVQAQAEAEGEATVRLYTEQFPPFSMSVGDGQAGERGASEVSGFATEIVRELFGRAEISYTLELVPWKRAYDNALTKPNHGVFSTTRTAEREDSFHWVSPLLEFTWVLMGRKDSLIELDELQQADQYRIGGYLADAIATHLEGEGLQIDYVANDVLNVRKLAKGRIDLWPVVQQKGYWLAKSEGVAIKEIFTIQRPQAGLALNRETDPALVAKLNAVLAAMHADGTVERITQEFMDRAPAAVGGVTTAAD